jgi:Iron-containing redox enzyme
MTVNKRGDFHKLINLNDHPDYHPGAQKIAQEYFEKVTVDSFSYSCESLGSWLQEEYSRSIASMKKPHWLDHGCTYSGDCYGAFSNEAVRERLRQNAPNNLIDGAWLNRIMPCGTATLAESILFRIRYEEAGNGDLAMHHPNVYSNLLHNQEIILPSVYTRNFSEDSVNSNLKCNA